MRPLNSTGSLLLLFPLLLSFSSNEKIVPGSKNFSHADTARANAIVDRIVENLPDTAAKSIQVIRKAYSCEYSLAPGFVNVYYAGKNVVRVTMSECGDDHGDGEVDAAFYRGRLVYYYWTYRSWTFDQERYNDSFPDVHPTTELVQENWNYIDEGKIIRCNQHYERTCQPSGDHVTGDETSYFSGCLVDSDASRWEKELQTWIDFANSPKSYEEYFGGKLH